MARFVYHSRIPLVVLPLFGIAAMGAFLSFVFHTPIPDRYLVWVCILFFGVATAVGSGVYRLIDRGTRRDRKVVPLVSDEIRFRKTLGAAIKRAPGAETDLDAMEWEIGPSGIGLFPHWLGTLVYLGLAASLASQVAWSRQRGDAGNGTSIIFCLASLAIPISIWASVVRFRINGQIVTVGRPYVPLPRAVSFSLSDIDQVDVTHLPHDRRYGKCLVITLLSGRRIKYSESGRVVDAVEQQLRSAIQRLRQVPHPLSDEAVL